MKKTLVLALVLITALMLTMVYGAFAEDDTFQAANSSDVDPYTQSADAGAPGQGSSSGSTSTKHQTGDATYRADGETVSDTNEQPQQAAPSGVSIGDSQLPQDASDGTIQVVIQAKPENPNYGDVVTLSSQVMNPAGGELRYLWQIDYGRGWMNIAGATNSEYIFQYSEALSNCAFRVYVYTPVA